MKRNINQSLHIAQEKKCKWSDVKWEKPKKPQTEFFFNSNFVCDGNKGVRRFLQSSIITEATPPDCLVSYSGHSLGKSYPSAKMQLVYSAAPVNWARFVLEEYYAILPGLSIFL